MKTPSSLSLLRPPPTYPHPRPKVVSVGTKVPVVTSLMAYPLPLVLCFALVVARAWGSTTPPTGTSEPPDVETVAPTEDDNLENEADNQENVLSQVR